MTTTTPELDESALGKGLGKKVGAIVSALALTLALFHLYTSYFGALPAMKQRSLHLGLVLAIIFLVYPTRRSWPVLSRVVDTALALASVGACGYLYVQADQFTLMALDLQPIDVAVGIVGVLLVLEATRRVMGWVMPLIASIFLAYAFLGPYLPRLVAHVGFSPERVAYHMLFTMEGILGPALGVSASLVAAFVIFSAFVQKSGVGTFFTDISFALFGRFRGGAAKVSVVSSSLFGTISGSAVANVVADGPVTIPMMRKSGYSGEFAGAVEAVSSTGGQITPPMLGAAAFLIVEFLGIPYTEVIQAAIFPAFLYYVGLFLMVDMQAAKQGLRGLPRSELPNPFRVIRQGWILIAPIVVLTYLLAWKNTSPALACFWAVVATFVVGVIHPAGELKRPKAVLECLVGGGKGMVEVAAACATAGIIIGVITLTGLGLNLATMLVTVADGNLAILLVLTAIVCLILGMGVPTTAAYLIVATLVAPALIKLGVPALAAHFFVFVLACMSMITPPVALAAYAAAGIAQADCNKTGFMAMRLGMTALILPFMIIYGPGLILQGDWQTVASAVVSATVGTYLLAAGLQGWCRGRLSGLQRSLFLASALLLIHQGTVTDLVGLALATGAFLLPRILRGRAPVPALGTASTSAVPETTLGTDPN